MRSLKWYFDTRVFIAFACSDLNIFTPKEEMTDDEIRRIMRWVGSCAADTVLVDVDKPVFGMMAIDLMLTVTLFEFPQYYMKYELAQFN